MRLCDQLTTQTKNKIWYAQGSAPNTKLFFQEMVLCNSLEQMHWSFNPIQVMLCETCGTEGCNSGGYVHLSKTGDYVIWSPPIWELPISSESIELTDADRFSILDAWGSLLFPISVWKEKIDSEITAYPATTHLDLMLSWLLEYNRLDTIRNQHQMMAKIHRRLISGSNLDKPTCLKHLKQLVAWFEAALDKPLSGNLVQASSISTQIEILDLDNPAQKWPAFVIADGRVCPAFGNDWVYLELS